MPPASQRDDSTNAVTALRQLAAHAVAITWARLAEAACVLPISESSLDEYATATRVNALGSAVLGNFRRALPFAALKSLAGARAAAML